jgi:tRNA threonylcarbamoyladenosine biosynthesis protein TsaE
MSTRVIPIETAMAMERFAAGFAQGLRESGVPIVITLQGPLGAGKTTWCRGLLRALGYGGGVKSPTYTLVESYPLDQIGLSTCLHHFDLYRLADPEELEYIGGRDYFDGMATCVIEWPEHGRGAIPPADVHIDIEYQSGGCGRRVTLTALTSAGEQVLSLIGGLAG